MKTCKPTFIAAIAAAACLSASAPAFAAAVFHYDSGANYKSAADSIFNSGGLGFAPTSWWLEDFEDGLMNTLGLSADNGIVIGPHRNTDSVDGDDGVIDGSGTAGYAFKLRSDNPSANFYFDAVALGGAPNIAGFVWTDGDPNATLTVKAWAANGDYLGKLELVLGDGVHTGSTAADRFIGVEWAGGISRLKVTASAGFVEMDHFQYGILGDDNGPPIVPLPAPVALGLAGLGIAGLARKRLCNRKA